MCRLANIKQFNASYWQKETSRRSLIKYEIKRYYWLRCSFCYPLSVTIPRESTRSTSKKTAYRLRSEYFIPGRISTIVHYVDTDFLCFHYPADYEISIAMISSLDFFQKGRFTTYQIKCTTLPSSYNIYLIVVDIEYWLVSENG